MSLQNAVPERDPSLILICSRSVCSHSVDTGACRVISADIFSLLGAHSLQSYADAWLREHIQ